MKTTNAYLPNLTNTYPVTFTTQKAQHKCSPCLGHRYHQTTTPKRSIPIQMELPKFHTTQTEMTTQSYDNILPSKAYNNFTDIQYKLSYPNWPSKYFVPPHRHNETPTNKINLPINDQGWFPLQYLTIYIHSIQCMRLTSLMTWLKA